jgi:hypothetical protein
MTGEALPGAHRWFAHLEEGGELSDEPFGVDVAAVGSRASSSRRRRSRGISSSAANAFASISRVLIAIEDSSSRLSRPSTNSVSWCRRRGLERLRLDRAGSLGPRRQLVQCFAKNDPRGLPPNGVGSTDPSLRVHPPFSRSDQCRSRLPVTSRAALRTVECDRLGVSHPRVPQPRSGNRQQTWRRQMSTSSSAAGMSRHEKLIAHRSVSEGSASKAGF